MDYGQTSTWDDWLVMRQPTGRAAADGAATMLQDPNFTMHDLDFSGPYLRDGLRQLFDEFETATAGQQVRGRALRFKRRAPDHWQVRVDRENGTVVTTFGAPTDGGFFTVMGPQVALDLVKSIVEALEQLDEGH